jgi:DNA ligase 1
MLEDFKPMLSATAKSVSDLKRYWPKGGVLASPKLDGIRCVIHPILGPVSRNLKPIPNDYIRGILNKELLWYLDGEIVTYTNGVMDSFNDVSSKVMSRAGEPEFRLRVFDYFLFPKAEFMDRIIGSINIAGAVLSEHVGIVPHQHLDTPDDFLVYAAQCVSGGYEGAMYRDPQGGYKYGRSTLTESWLVKWKTFMDAEGTVVGFEEKMHNANEATVDALGRTERSSHKAGMVPTGTLGALVLDTSWGQLRVGTGYTDQQRAAIWAAKSQYVGRTVTFKYQAEGSKDLPRFPVFKGWRNDV